MLSIDYIRANSEKVKQAAKNKNREADIEGILRLDEERRELIQQAQKLREERNTISKQKFTEDTKARGTEIKKLLKEIEDKLESVEVEFNTKMSFVPNVPLDDVPIGSDETGNVEIKKVGKPPEFTFIPKSHIELGEELDLIDLERGSKIGGFRGYFLKNDLALLHSALMFYVFQKLSNKGYTPMIAPTVVKGFTLFGSGHFPWSKEDTVYQLNDEDVHMSATAEIPVTAYYSGEILNEKDLPKKFVGFSPCYRREAGAYGRDTRGIYRVHEFYKIEQVIIGKNDLEEARKLHQELQDNCEEILNDLRLPYRVLLMCTGDMGEPQLIKYDTETWMPSRNGYGETMSNSIMGDFQARRLNIKYRKADGKTEFVYTFNNTALASPRILIAILENYQQEDGSVKIPDVLQQMMGKKVITRK